MSARPQVTVAVPSFNHGRFLDAALESIFSQQIATEVFVADGGSTDETVDILRKWAPRLAGWRSHLDAGQGAAINECVARGTAPYVCWLNSDDLFEPDGLATLIATLECNPASPAAYGQAWNLVEASGRRQPVQVERFSERRLAVRCIISQPATLVRRSAWEAVGGLDETLYLAMDYDLWWRLYRSFGPLAYTDTFVAVNREHGGTKTRRNRQRHYNEAIQVVRRHYGRVPWKWWLAQPYAVWYGTLKQRVDQLLHP